MTSVIEKYNKGFFTRRKNKFSTFFLLGIAIILTPGVKAQNSISSIQKVESLSDTYVTYYFERLPEVATLRGIPGADHGSISDPSFDAVEEWEVKMDSLYDQLQMIDVLQLQGSEAWVTYGYLREELETHIQMRICSEELWDVDQVNGWQVGISKLASLQPVGTDILRASALQRFGQIPGYVDSHIQNLREGLRIGYSAPEETVKLVLDQVDMLLEFASEDSPLFDPARRDSTPTFRNDFSQLIDEAIHPTIKRYRSFLSEEYLPAARTKGSLSANPNGAACYKAMLRKHTTFDDTPEEVHELGKKTIDSILEQISNIENPADPIFFSNRSEMFETTKDIISSANTEIPKWFGILPETEITVVPMPHYLEASGPGGRYFASPGQGSPARFQINLSRMRSRASLEKLTFHETIPGHHLQRAIALERTEAHPITRYFGYDAFNEGWALYAEMLANEMEIYTTNRGQQIMLESQLMNAHHLVLDTGIHALGWSRQQAMDYLIEHMGGNRSNIVRIIDYIIISPGQTTSYMVGNLKIRQLRSLAETELGDDFKITNFHDLLLKDGSIPLHLLQEKVENWISSSIVKR